MKIKHGETDLSRNFHTDLFLGVELLPLKSQNMTMREILFYNMKTRWITKTCKMLCIDYQFRTKVRIDIHVAVTRAFRFVKPVSICNYLLYHCRKVVPFAYCIKVQMQIVKSPFSIVSYAN